MTLPDRAHAPHHAVFFFDFGDPFAYLASRRIPRASREAEVALTLAPVHAGGLLEQRASAGAAARGQESSWESAAEAARRAGVTLRRPERYPFDSRRLLEACLFVRERSGQEAMTAVADALWQAIWERGDDPESIETAVEAGRGVAVPESAMRAGIEDPRITEVLERVTRRAALRGVRRVPTVQLEDRLFSGFDDVLEAERLLRGSPAPDRDGRREGDDDSGPIPDWTFSG